MVIWNKPKLRNYVQIFKRCIVTLCHFHMFTYCLFLSFNIDRKSLNSVESLRGLGHDHKRVLC